MMQQIPKRPQSALVLRAIPLWVLLLLAFYSTGFSQGVAINATNADPDASAILDLTSVTKGLLAPRMTATQRAAITSPATGLLVYQTDGTTGFYYYTGSAWQQIGGSYLTGSGSIGQAAFWSSAGGLSGDNAFTWDNTNKRLGVGTTAPNAALHIAATGSQDGNFLATGEYGSGAGIPITGAGYRMMWYPKKAAFRVGYVNGSQWDDASIGPYSIAMGQHNIASSLVSTALGDHTQATNSFSTATGSYTTASGNCSTAMGQSTIASGGFSTAMGQGTTASAGYSTATGRATTASGSYSTAMGAYASTNAKSGSFVIGDWSTSTEMNASANNEMSMRFDGGYRLFSNSALTDGLFISSGGNVGLGITSPTNKLEVAGQVKITGGSPAAGKVLTSDANGLATWETPAASGSTLDAAYNYGGAGSGRTITANAGAVTVSGVDGFLATGTINSGTIPATGAGTRMMWYPKKAAFRVGYVNGSQWDDANIGPHSIATGDHTTASGYGSTAMGQYTLASGSYATAMGSHSTASGGYSTAMGSGTASGSNSTAMGAGTIAAGESSTAMGAVTTASGSGSTAMGFNTAASGLYSTSMGAYSSTNSKSGSFIIGDFSTTTVLTASANNDMTMRFDGGYRLFSNSALTDGLFISSSGNVGLGVTAPTNKLEVDGQVKIMGGSPALGKVLTSDATGLASWETPATGDVTSVGSMTTGDAFADVTADDQWLGLGSSAGRMEFDDQTIDEINVLDANVGIGTSTPEFRLSLDNDGAIIANGAFGTGASLVTAGVGTRMIWYPKKAAFRAGHTTSTKWDDASIGEYSMATGRSTTASGAQSTAIGYNTTASGICATSMGEGNTASGAYSTVMGYHNTASGGYTTAMGAYVSTDGNAGSFIIGDQSTTTTMNASASNEMSMRFDGGFRLFTNSTLTDGLFISSGGNVGLGVTSPTNRLEVAGQVKITGGSPAAGKVLTSDVNGLASWETPAASGCTLGQAYDHLGPGTGRFITANAGAVTVGGTDGFLATGYYSYGTIPATGAGARMMWYPKKVAFRAGYVNGTEWDDTNIGDYSTATGFNSIASGNSSTAMGSESIASNFASTAIGYQATASGQKSTAFGVMTTASGNYSTAMGYRTSTNGKTGAFVIGDQVATMLDASSDNEISMRFTGGYRLFSSSSFTTGVYMTGGVSGWTNYSDRNKKENFTEIDGEALLGKIRLLPVTEWNYKSSDPSIRYIGPMAQDFWQAFHLGGSDSLGINSIAIDGVNLAAIKALEQRTAELHARTAELESVREELGTMKAELTSLRAMQVRLEVLEATMQRIQNSDTGIRTVNMVDGEGR